MSTDMLPPDIDPDSRCRLPLPDPDLLDDARRRLDSAKQRRPGDKAQSLDPLVPGWDVLLGDR